jgi:hypothetical protein
MVLHLLYYQLALLALVWLFVMLHVAESRRGAPIPPTATPIKPKSKRSNEPKPFNGLTQKPHCALCARDTTHPKAPPPVPPDPMAPTYRRPREVDTSRHFCPHNGCDYRGWLGRGNLRANGLPTICQAEFVTFFAPSPRAAHNAFGWHHSPYDDAAWPSGYAGVGRQYCVRPGHAAAPSPATPHTRC